MLHRFAKFVAACTVLLLLAGSLVTSTGSGPLGSRLADELRLEHVHVPAVEVGRRHLLRARPSADREHASASSRSCSPLALARRAAALDEAGSASPRSARSSLQGVLGGLTVLFFLPAAISTAHAGLAEIFFCMTVAIALFTSPGWIAATATGRRRRCCGASRRRRPRSIYAQILVGATMRHTGRRPGDSRLPADVRPPHPRPLGSEDRRSTSRIASARCVVTLAVVATSAHVWYHHREPPRADAAGDADRWCSWPCR